MILSSQWVANRKKHESIFDGYKIGGILPNFLNWRPLVNHQRVGRGERFDRAGIWVERDLERTA